MKTELQELAALYVLDRLEPIERSDFEARMNRDPELLAHVRELEGKLAEHVLALPKHEPPPALFDRIDARLDRFGGLGRAEPRRSITPITSIIARWGIAAVIAISLGAIAVRQFWPGHANAAPVVLVVGLNSNESTITKLPIEARAADPDGAFIQLASLAEQYWQKPQSLPVPLPAQSDNASRAYALFDPRSSQGFIGVEQLPTVEAGKRYHLWILDESGKVRDAGVLPVSSSTRGLYFFSVGAVESKSARVDFFITAEDATSLHASRPTGKVVLGSARF